LSLHINITSKRKKIDDGSTQIIKQFNIYKLIQYTLIALIIMEIIILRNNHTVYTEQFLKRATFKF